MVSFDEMKPNTVTIVLESRGNIGFVQVNGNNFRVLVTTKGGYLIDWNGLACSHFHILDWSQVPTYF